MLNTPQQQLLPPPHILQFFVIWWHMRIIYQIWISRHYMWGWGDILQYSTEYISFSTYTLWQSLWLWPSCYQQGYHGTSATRCQWGSPLTPQGKTKDACGCLAAMTAWLSYEWALVKVPHITYIWYTWNWLLRLCITEAVIYWTLNKRSSFSFSFL